MGGWGGWAGKRMCCLKYLLSEKKFTGPLHLILPTFFCEWLQSLIHLRSVALSRIDSRWKKSAYMRGTMSLVCTSLMFSFDTRCLVWKEKHLIGPWTPIRNRLEEEISKNCQIFKKVSVHIVFYRVVDPEPHGSASILVVSGSGSKGAQMNRRSEKISCFEVLHFLFWGLKASSVSLGRP